MRRLTTASIELKTITNCKGHPAFLNVKNELTRLTMDQSAHSQEGQLLESDAKYDTQPNYLYRNYINIALEMTHYLKILTGITKALDKVNKS